MRPKSAVPSVEERINEILREIGVLLFAFARLDAALGSERQDRWSLVLLFVTFGISLIVVSLLNEQRRRREP